MICLACGADHFPLCVTDTPDEKPTLGQELIKAAGEAIEWHRTNGGKVAEGAREWWIEGRTAYCEKVDGLDAGAHHVIEYAAYDAVVRERDELRAEVERLKSTRDNYDLQEEVKRLSWDKREQPDTAAMNSADTPAEQARDLVTMPASELRKLQDEVERLTKDCPIIHAGDKRMIDELTAERDRLRATLERIASELDTGGDCLTCCYDRYVYHEHEPGCAFVIARAALEGKD